MVVAGYIVNRYCPTFIFHMKILCFTNK